jgi:hypothetical protein
MIGAKMTPEQMERRREDIRRANDPAEIARRLAAVSATADEDYAAIGAALLAMAWSDGRCLGEKQDGNQNV